MAMASAHPMSLLSHFQPLVSSHASHSSSRTMLMLKEMDTSTKKQMWEVEGGDEMRVGSSWLERVVCHQERSASSARGGFFSTNGELRKFHDATKAERRGM